MAEYSKDNEESLGIANVIQNLRSELTRSLAAGANELLKFKAEKIELEIKFGVETKAEYKGGVTFKVLSLFGVDGGAIRTNSDSAVHTIKLSLLPVFKGGDALISSDDVDGLMDR